MKEGRGLFFAGGLAAGIFLSLVLPGCRSSKSPGMPSKAAIQFRDVTQAAGLACARANGAFGKKWMPETMGGGGAFLDYDNDGWLDILIITGEYLPGYSPQAAKQPTLVLYHNNHNGTFTDVTKQAGLNAGLFGMGVAVGDYDNDGYDDLFLTAVGQSRLFHNVADGHGGRKFVDVTASCGIEDRGWATSAAWVDYDNDGRLDLFVCHYVQWTPKTDVYCGTTMKTYCRPQVYPGESSRLYHNEGKGRFADVTKRAGVYNPNAKGLGICVCDLDGDGWPDLVVANDMEPTSVFRNNRNGTFRETALSDGLAFDESGHARAGMGIDAAYYRNNDLLGVAIGNFTFEGLALYQIAKTPPYQEQTKPAGLFEPSYPYLTFGLFFADFDNDGWPDLFTTNGHIDNSVSQTNPSQSFTQPCLLFRNNANGTFTEIHASAGAAMSQPLVGRGACRGDFDNDGKLDVLLIPNVGAPRLLHNETPTRNHWLMVKLTGTKSNRNGYGATVRVTAGGLTRTAYAHSGSSYLSAGDTRLFFGLGMATQIERVVVRWPSGKEETCGPVAVDRPLLLVEGQPRSVSK